MQLVLNFVDDPYASVAEVRRVVRPGGAIAACIWDDDGGVQMLRLFWQAAIAVDPSTAGENKVMRFGRDGEIGDLFREAGLTEVATGSLEVRRPTWTSMTSGIRSSSGRARSGSSAGRSTRGASRLSASSCGCGSAPRRDRSRFPRARGTRPVGSNQRRPVQRAGAAACCRISSRVGVGGTP